MKYPMPISPNSQTLIMGDFFQVLIHFQWRRGYSARRMVCWSSLAVWPVWIELSDPRFKLVKTIMLNCWLPGYRRFLKPVQTLHFIVTDAKLIKCFHPDGQLIYCAGRLALGVPAYHSSDWSFYWYFKKKPKCVFLHKGNRYGSIPTGHCHPEELHKHQGWKIEILRPPVFGLRGFDNGEFPIRSTRRSHQTSTFFMLMGL